MTTNRRRCGRRRRAPCRPRSGRCGWPSSTTCSPRRCAVERRLAPPASAVAAGPAGRREPGQRPRRPGDARAAPSSPSPSPSAEDVRAARRRGARRARRRARRARRRGRRRRIAGMIGLRSGQVAAAAGVNLQTLRYYERRGLLAEPERSPGGHRPLPGRGRDRAAGHQGRAAARVHPRRGGRPARRRAGTGTAAAPTPACSARAEAKLAEVEAKIADLQVIADTLRAALDAGCDDLVACAATDAARSRSPPSTAGAPEMPTPG